MGKSEKNKNAEKFLVVKMDINIMINYLPCRIYSYRGSLVLETKNKNNH